MYATQGIADHVHTIKPLASCNGGVTGAGLYLKAF